MTKFGPIQEVAPVKNYSERIDLSKKIFDIEMKIKEIHLCAADDSLESDDEKITRLEEGKADLEKNLDEVEEGDKKYLKFFVTFEREEDRNEALKYF